MCILCILVKQKGLLITIYQYANGLTILSVIYLVTIFVLVGCSCLFMFKLVTFKTWSHFTPWIAEHTSSITHFLCVFVFRFSMFPPSAPSLCHLCFRFSLPDFFLAAAFFQCLSCDLLLDFLIVWPRSSACLVIGCLDFLIVWPRSSACLVIGCLDFLIVWPRSSSTYSFWLDARLVLPLFFAI